MNLPFKPEYFSLKFAITLGIIFCTSCETKTRDRENYGDLSQTPRAIILDDPERHVGGYGRHECLVCHNAVLNIHRREGSSIDVEELNFRIKNGGESSYCLICHGRNGTSE
jgi:hypothetical protein